MPPSPTDEPCVTLERDPQRCPAECSDRGEHPYLVKVLLNHAARKACEESTGRIPPDTYVCVNSKCGALMLALMSLRPLQEIVK